MIQNQGITQVGKIYIDGTKVRANASVKRTKDVEGFEKRLSRLEEEMDELLKEAQLIDVEEEATYKTDKSQELLRKKLSNNEYLNEKGIDGYVPDLYFKQYKKGTFKEDRYHYSNFEYDEATNSYTCPEGKLLKYWKTRTNKTKKRQWNHKVYKGVDCGDCTRRSLCTNSKVRELLIDMRKPLLQEMRKKLTSKKGKCRVSVDVYRLES